MIFLVVSIVCFSIDQYTERDSMDQLKSYVFKVNLDNKYSLDNNLKSDDAKYSAKDFSSNIAFDFQRKVFYEKNKSKLNIKFGYLYGVKSISDNIYVYFDRRDDSFYELKDNIDLHLYEIKLKYEKLKFSDSINKFFYVGFFVYFRDGQNRFRKEMFKSLDVNLKLKNGSLIWGSGFGRISNNYELYWNSKFEKIINDKYNSELILGIKTDFKSIKIEDKNYFNSEYLWKNKLYKKFSLGLRGNYEKYFQFNSHRQSRIKLEVIAGLSLCEDWKDRIGFDLQSILNYEILKKLFGKTVSYNLQAVYESIRFKEEIPQRIIIMQNINVSFDISKHFSIVPAVGFQANWFKDSNSGIFYISTYDDFSYSSNSSSLFISEFSLKILYNLK